MDIYFMITRQGEHGCVLQLVEDGELLATMPVPPSEDLLRGVFPDETQCVASLRDIGGITPDTRITGPLRSITTGVADMERLPLTLSEARRIIAQVIMQGKPLGYPA